MKISTQDMMCFLMVAEQMSFTKAAALLFQTQPTVSRRIAHLEEELGAKLFDRTGKTLQLTCEGELAFQKINEIQQALRQLRSDICREECLHSILRIGCYGVYDYQIVGDISSVMLKNHPGIQLDFYVTEPGQGAQDLIEGKADLLMGVRCELEIDDSIEVLPIMPQQMVAFAHPEHFLTKKKNVRISDFREVEMVLWKRENAPVAYDGVLKACRKCGFTPRVWEHINHRHEMPIALTGEGRVSILPEGCLYMARNMGVIVRIEDLDICVDYCLAYRKDRISKEIQCFWEEMKKLKEIKRWSFEN